MVILYTYIKNAGNILACIPFRYNTDDEKIIESREVILDLDPESITYDFIKQQIVGILDKEKQDYGKLNSGYPGDMSNVIIIE